MKLPIACCMLLLAGCTRDSAPRAGNGAPGALTVPVVTSVRVNEGTYGMVARVKWQFSPDSSAILAMVDPAGVEAEAVPNGFFYGSESRNFQTRMDGVWDVAPSPDWGVIAFSRAFVMNPGESDSVPSEMIRDVARRSGLDAASVNAGSFAVSAMSMARGIAQPGTIPVPEDARAAGGAEQGVPRMYAIARGWRVRWTADGLVALGNNPARVQDDEPSESWTSLNPATGEYHGSLPEGARLLNPVWIEGPQLDVSTPIDMSAAPPIAVTRNGRSWVIESDRGVIRARETTPGLADPPAHTIGSGKALAATRGGRFILALAPRATVASYEVPVEAVVYVVGW